MSFLKTVIDTNAVKLRDMYARFDAEEEVAIQTVFAQISEYVRTVGAILPVAIKGWTPGFNDGEPCTHESEVYVGGMIVDDCNDILEEVDIEEVAFDADEIYSSSDRDIIRQFFEGISEYVQKNTDGGTDYIVLYVFNPDGTVDRHEVEYNCGW